MSDSTRSRSTQPHNSRIVRGRSSSANDARSSSETTFDDELKDEWWNDEESLISIPEKSQTASSQLTRWPTSGNSHPKAASKGTQQSIRKPVKRYSVQKPTREKSRQRQKKQNAKAGIKVNTNVSRHNPSAPIVQVLPSEPSRQRGCFVDLAALQALDSQIPNTGPGFWKSIVGKQSDNEQPVDGGLEETEKRAEEPITTPSRGFGTRRNKGLRPASLNLGDELSPSDRPIVIGISVPSASLAHHVTSPQTALSETSNIIQSYQLRSLDNEVPETPTIIITAAQEPSAWSALDSKSNPILPRTGESVPPVPRIPTIPYISEGQQMKQVNRASRIFTNAKSSNSRDSTRSRANSIHTVFEEDDSPIASGQRRSGSDPDLGRSGRRLSEGTVADDRRSRGWWNHIISPFLTRQNTVSFPNSSAEEHPPMPSLAIAAIEAQRAVEDQKWEKHFSPMTPTSATTIASDAWWDNRRTIDGMPKVADIPDSENGTYRSEEYGTLPFVLSAGGSSDPTNTSEAVMGINIPNDPRGRRNQSRNLARNPTLSPSDREAPLVFVGVADHTMSAALNPNTTVQSNPNFNTAEDLGGSTANQTRATRQSGSETLETPSQPPPYSPPRPNFRPYRALYPPGHGRNLQPPHSPGPVSPGLEQITSSRGGIALTDVPLTPAAPRRVINLNSGYPTMSSQQDFQDRNPVALAKSAEKARKLEARRRRLEKEDAIARKAGGLWRGRGCIPDSGCYGRAGPEGRKRRRWWFGLIAGTLTLIVLTAVLATQLHHTSGSAAVETQWLNLTAFPPIFTGISTVAVPNNIVANSGCVAPTTAWSCALPKELQSSVAPNKPNQPNFRMQIQWDNSSVTNASFGIVSRMGSTVGNSVSVRQFIRALSLKARTIMSFNPSPPPPSAAEQYFLGNTTDGSMSKNKAGEPTPFYITFLSTTSPARLPSKRIKRQSNNSTSQFPNGTALIPGPSSNADGTAAPANLLPFPVQQPIRLYDRGLPTEHYGFYNYFDRSIFLKSTKGLTSGANDNGVVPDDQNGGSTLSEAFVRCTWAQTRFLVQIWTKKGATAALLNSTLPAGSTPAPTTSNQTANNFSRPGSFPYPITITTDRHGGDIQQKLVYCYELDGREHLILSTAQQLGESRSVGGAIINPAPSLSSISDQTGKTQSSPSLGGFDGGTSGCSCSWTNFINVIGNV